QSGRGFCAVRKAQQFQQLTLQQRCVATLRIVTDYNAVDKRAEDFKRAMHNIRVVKDVGDVVNRRAVECC
ncbi:MAG: hypothetical protein ACKVLA_03295, partial [Rhodobacterales bacterium]